MKSLICCSIFLLPGNSAAFAQDEASNGNSNLEGFEWLKQFQGSWKTVSKAPGATTGQTATLKSRAIGNHWIVNEHSGDLGGMKFEAAQTLGYDSTKKQFVGSWVDSMMVHTWNYNGSLDETGKKLMLEAEGPDMSNPKKMRLYRDVYEFKSKDEIAAQSQMKNDKGEWVVFINSVITRSTESAAATEANDEGRATAMAPSPSTVAPFLMFIGKAEEAIEFYKTVFPDTKVVSMEKYKAGEANKEGTVKLATFEIEGQQIRCTDSPDIHDFTFTPSFSFFVECESVEQLKERFAKLSDGGKVMMPVNNYGFSQQFGWTSDKFGVSWQLNLK